MMSGEFEHGLPSFKSSKRLQVCKQEPLASDDSHLSEDSSAEVHLDFGMMLLLEACEKLAEEECTAETKPPSTRRSAPKRNYAAVDYSEGNTKAESKPQKASSSSKRRSRTELHGPCCHCGVMESPQWRKGPLCKPVLCNACGTRFLRTRCLGKIVMGRNGRRYTKEATPEAEVCCENSTGSTDDVHPAAPPACPTRRDSRLGLSRPSKTRRLDTPSTRAPSTRRRTAALQSPAPKPPSRAAPPPPRPATSATSASTSDDSSGLLHVSATLSRLAALPPSTDAAAVALLKRLLAPATSAPAPAAFVLPPVPLLDMGLAPPPSTPAHPTRYSQQRLQQRHQQALQQLQQQQQQQMQAAKPPATAASRAGKVPIYLHVQAGPMPVL